MKINRKAVGAVLLLAVGGAVLLFTERGPVDWTDKDEITIVLTREGFRPQEVYIHAGTKVTFVSERDGQFWPASDLHPFHTIYKEFDPRRPLDQSEQWSVVLDKEGHWSYHDHIDPITTGALIVVPPGVRADARYDVIAECTQDDLGGRQACWKLQIQFALQKKGLDAAFEKVGEIYTAHEDFRRDCHLYVHDLGLLAYQRYGDTPPLTERMATCGQGFFHGYLEGLLSYHKGNVSVASTFCSRVGVRFKETFPLAGPQCYHGIGHGQMEYIFSTRPDLMNALSDLVGLGISDCGLLSDDDSKFRCASGAYAVTKDWINIQSLRKEYPEFFSLDDVYALCRHVSDGWATRACAWEFSKQAYITANKSSDLALQKLIASGREWKPEYLDLMVTSMAFLVGELGVSKSDTELVHECDTARMEGLGVPCIAGIENGLLFNGKPEAQETERSVQFCNATELTSAEKTACTDILVRYMSGAYGAEGLRTVCVTVPDMPVCMPQDHQM